MEPFIVRPCNQFVFYISPSFLIKIDDIYDYVIVLLGYIFGSFFV